LKQTDRKVNFPQQASFPRGSEPPTYPTMELTTVPSVAAFAERDIAIDDTQASATTIGVKYPNAEDLQNQIVELKLQVDFYQELAHTFSKILKSNNIKLLTNLIDQSGKIILDTESLCILIGLITNSNAGQVNIQYESTDGDGCFAKINPIHKIETIKIGYIDFQLGYNTQYNTLQEKFAVSLRKVIVSSKL
jgi:hypothetical protein